MLSSNALQRERVKTKFRSSSVSNDKGADPTQILPPKRGLKLAPLNINKLTTHIDELRVLLANNDTDVLSINETKLIKNASDDEVHIPGYDIIRRDRIVKDGGGQGMFLFVPCCRRLRDVT